MQSLLKDKKKWVGFSITELLFVMAIIAMCTVMATPYFRESYRVIERYQVSHQIMSELYEARNLALTRKQSVSYTCTEKGWNQIRLIRNNKGVILRTFKSLPNPYQLTLCNSLHRNNAIVFTELGFTLSERCSFYLMAFEQSTRIIISWSGRVRVESNLY